MPGESPHLDNRCGRSPGCISTVVHQTIDTAEGQCAILVDATFYLEFSRLTRGCIDEFFLTREGQLDRTPGGLGQQDADGFKRIHVKL